MDDKVKRLISNLPKQPGVYRFYDINGEVLYVGKAKNIKNRVASHFSSSRTLSAKQRVLIAKTAGVDYIIVDTESDALLLENNLIKTLKPRYNVLLKDDKSYPWVCIKNEPFPRVFTTRNVITDGSQYFGPFTSGVRLKNILDLIRQLFPLRTCNFNLSKQNIEAKKFKACIEYQIGNCLAPCINSQTEESYKTNIKSIIKILNGENEQVIRELKIIMATLAADYRFEEAEAIRNKIDILTKYQAKTTIVNKKISNLDVFSILKEDTIICINYLKVVNGSIVQVHNYEVRAGFDETDTEILGAAIVEVRQRFSSSSRELLVSIVPEFKLGGIKYTVPKTGDKRKLLELSLKNCKEFLMDLKNQKARAAGASPKQRILETIKADLRMQVLPVHIECFDNSNLQGTSPVAACVVFKNARPSKREYRHYNIKTVEGPDDFASMREVVYRRYSRLMEEGQPIPQLVIIDGGKGQVSAALESLTKLGINEKITLIGIAKRLEEIYFPNDPAPLHLDKRSETLKVIQLARNEAHRFGLAFHRNKRKQKAFGSKIRDVKGIGEKTWIKLMKYFSSEEEVIGAELEELKSIIGKESALKIKRLNQEEI